MHIFCNDCKVFRSRATAVNMNVQTDMGLNGGRGLGLGPGTGLSRDGGAWSWTSTSSLICSSMWACARASQGSKTGSGSDQVVVCVQVRFQALALDATVIMVVYCFLSVYATMPCPTWLRVHAHPGVVQEHELQEAVHAHAAKDDVGCDLDPGDNPPSVHVLDPGAVVDQNRAQVPRQIIVHVVGLVVDPLLDHHRQRSPQERDHSPGQELEEEHLGHVSLWLPAVERVQNLAHNVLHNQQQVHLHGRKSFRLHLPRPAHDLVLLLSQDDDRPVVPLDVCTHALKHSPLRSLNDGLLDPPPLSMHSFSSLPLTQPKIESMAL